GLGLVVAGQVGQLETAAHHRPEEFLSANGASDDQVTGIDAVATELAGRLDELSEPLRRVDETEIRDDRPLRWQPKPHLRGRLVAWPEPLEGDGVRNHERADAEDARDVVVDRNRGRRKAPDRSADELRAAVDPA